MISLDTLWSFLIAHAYVVVFFGTLIDATGTPFPGRLMLIAAGALAASDRADPVLVVALAAAAAVLGDHVWYLAGRRAGDRLLRFYCRFAMLDTPGCVERAQRYLRRFGPAAVIVGRFVAGVRIVVTPLAAQSGMPYAHYLACTAIGATLWCSLWVLVGFVLGDQWLTAAGDGDTNMLMALLGMGVGMIALVAVAARLMALRREGRRP